MESALNITELTKAMWGSLPSNIFSGLGFLISIAKIAGILVLIYLAFLIIQTIVKIRQAFRLKQLQLDVAEIKESIALIAGKKTSKSKDKKPKA